MSNRNAGSVALLAALLVCAGCSPFVLWPGTLPGTAAARQAPDRAEGSGPFLYVGGLKLSMYALGTSTPLHVAGMNPSTVYKAAIALDSHGHLCEANGEISHAQFFEYDADTLKVVRERDGVGAFPALVADHLGYLYASTGGAYIEVYAPGCTHHVNAIRRGANDTKSLVFDSSGNLYLGNTVPDNSVSIYAPTKRPGHMKLIRQIRDGLSNPIALAIGPSDDLFVANWSGKGDGYITVYRRGAPKPVLRITKGLRVPLALAVDAKGRLYVANNPNYDGGGPSRAGWISVYAPGDSQPIRRVRLYNPIAFTFDPSDNVYVANLQKPQAVFVYSPGAAKLLLKIKDGLSFPDALLIGSP